MTFNPMTDEPPLNIKLLVLIKTHPREFEDDYTAYADGSDRTEENLQRRKYARQFIKKNPIQFARAYKTAFSGIKWMVLSNSDSSQGFIADKEITGWCELPTITSDLVI